MLQPAVFENVDSTFSTTWLMNSGSFSFITLLFFEVCMLMNAVFCQRRYLLSAIRHSFKDSILCFWHTSSHQLIIECNLPPYNVKAFVFIIRSSFLVCAAYFLHFVFLFVFFANISPSAYIVQPHDSI